MEQTPVKRLALGVLAHVDAGKTTLSEAVLFQSGKLRRLGRVDHRDAFLDTDVQERERGITIFSKQAEFSWKETAFTLLDTPGHVDFSSETERTLQVLDCAVLVISGADGVQGHTETLWRLLRRYEIPTFLFVNKMDQPGTDRATLMAELKRRLSDGCVDFEAGDCAEQIAMCGEEALAAFLETGVVPETEIRSLIAKRKLFPCLFGSALKLTGVTELLDALNQYAPVESYSSDFGARVYKIVHDPQGVRLTYLKITGGTLRVKELVSGVRSDGTEWEEKVNQIRFYSGSKFRVANEACAGEVCAVTGLSFTRSGEGLGAEREASAPLLEPVFSYRLISPPDCDPHTVLQRLQLLEEEDPQLHVVWNSTLREIRVQLMGEVQLEILRRLLRDRFGMDASFEAGGILYRETISDRVEGVGHYEPLRHYAEVHLILEPLEPGSGLHFETSCSEDVLDRNWQRLILTHLAEKTHLGVLTGAPITDMRITLAAGRAHLKHTEGGDFRQATYRAVRHGLMRAKSVLLEPWYDLRLELPASCVGRAMSDVQQMGGSFLPPETEGDTCVLQCVAPVAEAQEYAREVTAYTRGTGRVSFSLHGYRPCRDQDKIVAEIGYDPERDLDNSPDSIFCSKGAGFPVKWSEVTNYMHLESALRPARQERAETRETSTGRSRQSGSVSDPFAEDQELQAIFERTYGPIRRRDIQPRPKPAPVSTENALTNGAAETAISGNGQTRREPSGKASAQTDEPEYLLVDGYNLLFAWEDLRDTARENLDVGRKLLLDILSNYQGYRKCVLIVVFDAYRVPRAQADIQRYNELYVVFTKEAETADAYIEKATYEMGRHKKVRVATSDGLEQLIILGHGALRVSAPVFRAEVESVIGQIHEILLKNNGQGKLRIMETALEKAQTTESDKRS